MINMEALDNYADIYKKWEEAGRPDWTGGPKPYYDHNVMVGSCAIDPNWNGGQSFQDGNLQLDYLGIHHTCYVADDWYKVRLADQEPKQSSKMVVEDLVGRHVYIGDKLVSGYIDSEDVKNKVVEKTVNMKADPVQDNVNLTYPEQTILLYTKQTWNTFINLPNKSEDDIAEFKDAIHRLQQIIALRVARRVDTAVWLQP